MEQPYFSIVICAYNADKYIKKCINSILEQTYRKFELIIINDGSTDSTRSIIEEYQRKDNRVRLINQKNKGILIARLVGLQQVKGHYFLFCDSDDYFSNKNALNILYHKSSDVFYDLIQFGFYNKYNHIKISKRITKVDVIVDENEFLLNHYPALLCNRWQKSLLKVTVWGKLYKSSLLSNLPDLLESFSRRQFWGEDIIINLYLLQTCKCVLFIKDILYTYQANLGLTKTYHDSDMKDLNSIKEIQLQFLSEYKCGNNGEEIERNLFGEIAAWFFIYVKDSLSMKSVAETEKMIEETLDYSSFIKAKDYYNNYNNEQWLAVNLLRTSSSQDYIRSVQNIDNYKHKNIKNKIITLIQKL